MLLPVSTAWAPQDLSKNEVIQSNFPKPKSARKGGGQEILKITSFTQGMIEEEWAWIFKSIYVKRHCSNVRGLFFTVSLRMD